MSASATNAGVKKHPPRKRDRDLIKEAQQRNFQAGQQGRNGGPIQPPPKSSLKKPMLVLGSIVALLAVGACVCSNIDDDDCDSMAPNGEQVFAAGFSGVQAAPPAAREQGAVVPATGGFGTHLASCGG